MLKDTFLDFPNWMDWLELWIHIWLKIIISKSLKKKKILMICSIFNYNINYLINMVFNFFLLTLLPLDSQNITFGGYLVKLLLLLFTFTIDRCLYSLYLPKECFMWPYVNYFTTTFNILTQFFGIVILHVTTYYYMVKYIITNYYFCCEQYSWVV